MGKERLFNKDTIKGACPKVPQQNNFTDCGLYVLQYVEHFLKVFHTVLANFFMDIFNKLLIFCTCAFQYPILDYHVPIKELKEWFDEFIVTRKREDVSLLIKKLMVQQNKDPNCLPELVLPTLNGKFF